MKYFEPPKFPEEELQINQPSLDEQQPEHMLSVSVLVP